MSTTGGKLKPLAAGEIIKLKEAYERLQSLEIAIEYGALRAYKDNDRAQRIWRTVVDPAVDLVAQSEAQTSDGGFAASAPSPWHGYFYLRARQQLAFRGGRSLDTTSRDAGANAGDHMFFRGQRCVDWPFKSSLQRKAESQRAAELRATTALCEYFRLTFLRKGEVAISIGRCFAQHYGIATDLADISCEPDIAVWFATNPPGAVCPGARAEGVVRAFTWAGQHGASKTAVSLPPPFVRNLHTQRGLFLDTSLTNGEIRGRPVLDVSFPRKTEGGAFDIVRQGQKVQVWPEPDKYEKELVGWARAIGAACGSDDEVRVRVRQERETASFPALWRERGLANFESHVKPWLSMLDWVLPRTCITALPVTGEQAPMRYEILDLKVRQLVRDNLEFFRSFVDATKVDTDFSDHEVIRTVLQFARREIARLEAQAWWTTHGNAEAVCDGCNGKLKRDDGYAIRERTVRVGPATINMDEEILCGSCFDRLVVHGK